MSSPAVDCHDIIFPLRYFSPLDDCQYYEEDHLEELLNNYKKSGVFPQDKRDFALLFGWLNLMAMWERSFSHLQFQCDNRKRRTPRVVEQDGKLGKRGHWFIWLDSGALAPVK